MKPIEGYDKLRGGYYTPSDIADFIVRWVGPTPENTILEAVAMGVFLLHLKIYFRIISRRM